MHGDRVLAAVHTEKDREVVEPEELVEPFLTRFVGRVQKKTVTTDCPLFLIIRYSKMPSPAGLTTR